jgi:hypothetical protein
VTFDVEEEMMERNAQSVSELVILAKRLLPPIREQLRGFPIDVEHSLRLEPTHWGTRRP